MNSRVLVAIALAVVAPRPANAQQGQQSPLTLSKISIAEKKTAAVPPGGGTSSVTIQITSTKPFCIQGMRMNTNSVGVTAKGMAGNLTFALDRLDGLAMSHESIKLYDGASTGSKVLDIVVSYGAALCASGSIQFRATQSAATVGSGVPLGVSGQAIILAPFDAVISVP